MRYRKKEGGKRVAVVWVVAGLDHRGGGRRGVGGWSAKEEGGEKRESSVRGRGERV